MRLISSELHRKRAAAGRKGGHARFFAINSAGMAAMGRLGGRPRLLSLAELKSRVGAGEKTNINKGVCCEADISSLKNNVEIGALALNMRRGGLASSAALCSPGRSAG